MSLVDDFELGLLRVDRGEFLDKANYGTNPNHPDFVDGAEIRDGVTDARRAFLNAQDFAAPHGLAITPSPGIYRFASNTTLTAPVRLEAGVELRADAGVTLTISGPTYLGDTVAAVDTGAGTLDFTGPLIGPGTLSGIGVASISPGDDGDVLQTVAGSTGWAPLVISDADIPESAVVQHEAALDLTVAQLLGGAQGQTLRWGAAVAYWADQGAYFVEDFGAVGDGVTDDTTAIQACLDAAGGGYGASLGESSATVWARAAVYGVSATLEVPDKVTFRGVGRSKTFIRALGTFDSGQTAVLRLGKAADSRVFACRLEHMMVLADPTRSDMVAVYSNALNEQSGVFHCGLRAGHRGVLVDLAGGGVPAHYSIRDNEVLMNGYSPTATSVGIEVQSAGGYVSVVGNTVIGDLVNETIQAGLWARSPRVFVRDFHPEGCTYGVQIGDAAGSSPGHGSVVSGVNGPSSNASCPTLVRVEHDAQGLTLQGLTRATCTNTIQDMVHGRTIQTPNVAIYVTGTGPVGSRTLFTDAYQEEVRFSGNLRVVGDTRVQGALNHDGSGVGFYGRTPTARAAAVGPVSAVTDSTGGSADGVLSAVGDTSVGDESGVLNDNFTDLHTQVEALRVQVEALRTALGKTSGVGLTND